MIGGDLLTYLIKKTVLSEEETKFYAAEMICCIEEAHAIGYIHRDIKPGMSRALQHDLLMLIHPTDNFLFTSQGHLKLCDFGLAFSGHQTHDNEYLDQQRHELLKKVGIVMEEGTLDQKESQRIDENIPLQSTQINPGEDIKGSRGLARSIVGTNQ